MARDGGLAGARTRVPGRTRVCQACKPAGPAWGPAAGSEEGRWAHGSGCALVGVRARRRPLRVPPCALRAALPWRNPASLDQNLGGCRVTDTPRGKSRFVTGEIRVAAPPGTVWDVLTDFESLVDVVPNLQLSRRLPSKDPQRIVVHQVGSSSSPLWRLEASVVLEVTIRRADSSSRVLDFVQIQGDFERYQGRWIVEPADGAGQATMLRWEVEVVPKVTLPGALLSRVVAAGLPANMQAIARHAESLVMRGEAAAEVSGGAMSDTEGIVIGDAPAGQLNLKPWEASEEALAAIKDAVRQQANAAPARMRFEPFTRRAASPGYLGTDTVPIPGAGTREDAAEASGGDSESWERDLVEQIRAGTLPGLQGASMTYTQGGKIGGVALPPAGTPPVSLRLAPDALKGKYPAFDLGSSGALQDAEVHLRRLDDDQFLHLRVVALVRVHAPLGTVWDVLTDFPRMSDFLPNMAVSEIVPPPRGVSVRPGVHRVRQVAFKEMMYMVLHGEVVFDVVERREQGEIQFRMAQGDIHALQGKWMLQEEEGDGRLPDHTLVKLAVEVKFRRSVRSMLFEPFIEVGVFEDLSANMAALRHRAEDLVRRAEVERRASELAARGETEKAEAVRMRVDRPPARDLREDLVLLCAELRREFGEAGVMPSRGALRERGRSDLERAIAAQGGTRVVAAALGWELPPTAERKPKGYWSNPDNLRQEIEDFNDEMGLPATEVPTKRQLAAAGRTDIMRAIAKFGGYKEVAEHFGMTYSDTRTATSTWHMHVSQVARDTGLSGANGLFELAASTYDSVDFDDEAEGGQGRDEGDEEEAARDTGAGAVGLGSGAEAIANSNVARGAGARGDAAVAGYAVRSEARGGWRAGADDGRVPVQLGVSGEVRGGRRSQLEELDWQELVWGEGEGPSGDEAEDGAGKRTGPPARAGFKARQQLNNLRANLATKRIDWRADLRRI